MIACEQVTKRFGSVTALAPFDLSVDAGEFIAVKGVSGSGKPPLIRPIGGLIGPGEGPVIFDGADWITRTRRRGAD